MNEETKLYEAFCAYIEACVKLNKRLWDSAASVDLLKSNQKESHFIRNFESKEKFKDLARFLFEYFGYKKPNTEDVFEYSSDRLPKWVLVQEVFIKISEMRDKISITDGIAENYEYSKI